jgi:preprotein translocase subunit SecB
MSEQEPAATEANGAQFALQRIYVKDASFESPRAPEIFRSKWQPKVNMELNSSHTQVEEGLYEVVLQITITAKSEDDTSVYLTEIQQAGIFLIKGLEPTAMSQTLGAFCPSVLFPYAREAIDNMVIKGSFPPLMLAPVNFDAIYEQTLRQQQEATH